MCGRNLETHNDVQIDVRCYKDGHNFFERITGTTKGGEICKKTQESRLKWYGHVS